ncbi:MAG: HD domain-containing protein [Sulfuritalea sp.]|jgi:putative nucleotidyltransferase with HDIG domain|nr:HD domain-containing protein [Sulfuritalea sp.]
MSGIHRIIFNRLLAAWVVVSLLTGAAVSLLGLSRIDGQLVDLTTAELAKVSAASLPLLNRAESQRSALNQLATDFVHHHAIAVEFRDRNRNKVAVAVNPIEAELEQELRRQSYSFPADADRHFKKITADGETVLRVLVPIKEPAGEIAGYVEGTFLVDRETLGRLRHEMIFTLLVVLFAVTLTTVCLYPVMLSLNRSVVRYSNDLLKGNVELMEVLGSAIAKRDAATNIHNYRVVSYAVRLAETVGLKPGEIRDLIAGAFLHDVGKIGISDNILLKPGPLDAQEFETMRTHVTLGVEILRKSDWLQKARDVVEYHHEKFDGSGYIKGLAGEAIPVTARIFAIVDVFDALTSRRPYKEPFPFAEAMAILQQGVGTHFDPRLAAAFGGIAEALFREVSTTPDAAVESRLQALIAKYFFASR